MADVTAYVEDKQTSEFYPTPEKIVNRMLDKVKWDIVETILEPSAGKGDILKGIFTCPELIDRFNIYAAQQRGWLPPSYGKKQYAEMDAEEKAVVDSFQGAEAYAKVMRNPGYYLAAPVKSQNLLEMGEEV